MIESLYSPDSHNGLINSLQSRVKDLFHPFEIDFVNTVDINLCLETLKSISPACRAQVLKTWLNGWVTSHRMHEPNLLPCIFGCAGEQDTLSHYVMCSRVFAAAKFVVPLTGDDPLVRCGLSQPSKQNY